MFLKILLQGLDPNLSGYEAALTLYEREAGPQPEKVCHFVFLEHVLLEEFEEKKDIEKYLKEYSHFSLLWGTVLHTVDDVLCNSNENQCP